MRSRLTSLLAVIGAVTVLVLAANTVALAATGRGFLLGQTNQTAKLTTLQRITTGPALRLQTKNDTAAPFSTNATGKVRNLDADTVDGLDGAALTNPVRLHGVPYNQIIETRHSEVYDTSRDAPATTFTGTMPSQGYASNLITYNVTLTGGSGRSECKVVRYDPGSTGGGPYYGTTTATGDSPSISGVTYIASPQHPFGLELTCTSGTPFTVTGVAVDSTKSFYDECEYSPQDCPGSRPAGSGR